jgi:heavy metal sensor kinase
VSLPIRARLTLWYSGVLCVVLALSAAGLYALHARGRLAQVDEELARTGALVARVVPTELAEGAELPAAAREALEDIELPGLRLAVFDGDGTVLTDGWQGLPPLGGDVPATGVAVTVPTPAGNFRVHRALHRHEGVAYQVGVARSLAPVEQEMAALRRALLASVAVALVLAVGGGVLISRGALAPVAEMAAQAKRISAATPGRRLTPAHPRDDLGRLAGAFNDVLGRLESVLQQQRQFMADASHELRTPVSIGRTAAEVTLARTGRPEQEYRDALAVAGEQMRRLSRIVDDLFTLARADATGLSLQRAALYVDELVADCVRETRLLASPKAVSVEWQGPADLEIEGDARWLQQMLTNLLDNAIRHTPDGGSVRVEVAPRDHAVEIAVADTGSGIPADARERVFERFVRLDDARSGPGAGLGLPIARAVAEAHGGTLVLGRSDAGGSTFVVRLPRPGPVR